MWPTKNIYETNIKEISLIVVCINSTPSQKARCDTRSIFKQSKVGLNSQFSFSLIGCLTKVKEPNLPYYLYIAGKEKKWIHSIPRALAWKWNLLKFWFIVTSVLQVNREFILCSKVVFICICRWDIYCCCRW